MSNSAENDLDLDLHFLPAWAKEPSNRNLYADFEGGGEGRPGRSQRDRPFGRRPDGPPRNRPEGRPPGERRRPEGPGAGGPGRRRFEDRGRGGPRRDPRPQREALPPKLEPLLEVKVAFRADDRGVDSLSRQIKMTGRAYPLFGVAQMVLAKPERHSVTFSVKKGPEGQVLQPLFVCALDDTLWLSEQEAVDYALNKHFNTFYQAEKTAIEPPKGTYTFVAQCGMSGNILGPPNHHDYQNQLRKLHAERYARMPFEVYRSRVRIVRDEAVIKKWLDSQSWKVEYACLNMPEPLRLGSREEVERHFREHHLPVIIRQVETHTMSGTASRGIRSGPLMRLLRQSWEDQKRFPLQIATVLSQQFASRGLQFFKVNKNVTHVTVARPLYLDLDSTPVSTGVRQIITFINARPKCTRRQLLDALAPAPAAPPAPAPAPAAEASAEAGETPAPPAQPAAAPAPQEPSPEANMIISDLHWLIHQGHVIEFADGLLETAKKPAPRPQKPQASPVIEAAPGAPPSPAELAAEAPPEPPAESPAEPPPAPAEEAEAAVPAAESTNSASPGTEAPAPAEAETRAESVAAEPGLGGESQASPLPEENR